MGSAWVAASTNTELDRTDSSGTRAHQVRPQKILPARTYLGCASRWGGDFPTAKISFTALIAYGSDPHAQQPSDSTALRPYVTDPAARGFLEKLIKAEWKDAGP